MVIIPLTYVVYFRNICSMKYTVREFFKQFPDDDTCLEHLMEVRYGKQFVCPKCKKDSKFHRIAGRPFFSCQFCGHHIHPMVDTPFYRTRTPLQLWFYAIYLFTTSRHGVPAKELERQLGVTYKTAWRMGHEIRKYMSEVDGDNPLSGHVEIDEAYIGGKGDTRGRPGKDSKKTAVLGMMQRDGDVVTKVVADASRAELMPHIKENVTEGSRISTDQHRAYTSLPEEGYQHDSVNHAREEYVRGDVHTNSIEGYWARLKLSISGTHVHVSRKHLDKYLGEFEYRYNMRKQPKRMFSRLIVGFADPSSPSAPEA